MFFKLFSEVRSSIKFLEIVNEFTRDEDQCDLQSRVWRVQVEDLGQAPLDPWDSTANWGSILGEIVVSSHFLHRFQILEFQLQGTSCH